MFASSGASSVLPTGTSRGLACWLRLRSSDLRGSADDFLAASWSLRYSRFELTNALLGLERPWADFVREIDASPMSSSDGRWPSSEGREDVGDLAAAAVAVAVCDLDRCMSSNAGRLVGGRLGCREAAAASAASDALGWLVERL